MRGVFALGLVAAACSAPERDCSVELWYVDDAARSVAIVGDFNGWNAGTDPMVEVGDGVWRLELDLSAGDYEYMVAVDGVWVRDPFAPLMSLDTPTGEEKSLLRVPDCGEPALEVGAATASPDGSLHVEAVFLRGQEGRRLDVDSVRASLFDGTAVDVEADSGSGRIAASAVDLPSGKHTVVLEASDRAGRLVTTRVPLWVEDAPFVWEDALIYQIMVDRFAGADGGSLTPDGYEPDRIGSRFGGVLSGIQARLEAGYFDALGANVLWLSPVYEGPAGAWPGVDGRDYEPYHGYWPVSSEVEPVLGGEAALTALIRAAHERGVRVILDVVPNHVHSDHDYYLQSPDWFHEGPSCICGDYSCPWDGNIESCWFTAYLPDFDFAQPGVADLVVDDTVGWIERFDLDGFRVDAVPMMPRSMVRLIVHGAREYEPIGARFFTLGETYTGTGSYDAIRANLGPFGLDGQFEFQIMWALRSFVAHGSADAAALDAVIVEAESQWEGSGSVMSPFIGNHDMTRFLSEAAGDAWMDGWTSPPPQPTHGEPYAKLVVAHALTLGLPGAPVLYYGDEIGLAGAGDPDCRRPMVFDADLSELQASALSAVQQLGQARRCSDALRRGERQTLHARDATYAFLRDSGADAAVVVINASDAATEVDLLLPSGASVAGELTDVTSGETAVFEAGQTTSLTVPAWTARVFVSASCASWSP